MVTAHRAAWEFVHGALPPGCRVYGPDDPACVRVDHLRLEEPPVLPFPPQRGQRGTGTLRQVRPGVWEMTIPAGRYSDGTPRRLGLSRTEFLRRQLASITEQGTVTLEDLDRFSELAADLGDPEVMAKAWE